jgi:hypothetical protein
MIDFAADLDTMFDTDEHAQDATYIRSGYPSTAIPIILYREYSDPQGVGTAGVSASAPIATCKTSDVSGASRGDTLATLVNGVSVTYKVTEVLPDGTGVTLLRLSED